MYDDTTHVRVRILSSKPFPVTFEEYLETSVEQDNSSLLFRRYSPMKTFESAKSNIYSFFTDGKKSIKKMFSKEDRPDA